MRPQERSGRPGPAPQACATVFLGHTSQRHLTLGPGRVKESRQLSGNCQESKPSFFRHRAALCQKSPRYLLWKVSRVVREREIVRGGEETRTKYRLMWKTPWKQVSLNCHISLQAEDFQSLKNTNIPDSSETLRPSDFKSRQHI